MSKVTIITGEHHTDNLAAVVNSNDSFINISIDVDSCTDDFKRVTQELDIFEQVKLYRVLHDNIDKWKNEIIKKNTCTN